MTSTVAAEAIPAFSIIGIAVEAFLTISTIAAT
jgi:hypothetical protein